MKIDRRLPTYSDLLAMDHPVIDSIVEGIGIIESAAAELSNSELDEAIAASIRLESEETDPHRRMGVHLIGEMLSEEKTRRRLW